MKRLLLFVLLLCGATIAVKDARTPVVTDRFQVPEGFVVEEVVSPKMAGSIVAITFDSRGQLVLGREDSLVVTLVDQDGDGVFEERVFTTEVYDTQGLFFDGLDLLASGMGPDSVALYRVVDDDGDSRGDRVETIERSIGTMGDHGPHQPFFGPDGYLYWTLGNMSATHSSAAPGSPLRGYKENVLAFTRTDPRGHAVGLRVPGGTFVRKDLARPDSDWEEVAGGFRNQYDGAFNLMGELFTFDSDMEWDRDLPWFRETRSVHAVPGGDYGWRTGAGKHPPYYIDTLPPMEDVGRGSPVGVSFYQSYAYPAGYYDALLQGDWSRGRIILGHVTRSGGTYTQESSQNFVYGEPLNVTDLDVGPDGSVYFALGGRDTAGGVYRVVYTGADAMGAPEATTPLERVLTMPQPRSAWSRAMAQAVRTELGEAVWRRGLAAVALDGEAEGERRMRALELLQVFGPGVGLRGLINMSIDESPEMRAAAVYYLGLDSGAEARRAMTQRLKDGDPLVQRRAVEALVRSGVDVTDYAPLSATADIFPLLSSESRVVRYAGKELLRRINLNEWKEAALALDGYPEAPLALLAYMQALPVAPTKDVGFLVRQQLALLEAHPSDAELLDLIRTMQVTMVNDLGLSFTGRDGPYPRMADILMERFPSTDRRLNREIARVLAHLKPERATGLLAAELTEERNDRKQQIHYAYVLSLFEDGWDEASAGQMIAWFEKTRDEQWKGGASFAGYLALMLESFAENQTEAVRARIQERIPQLVADEAGGQLTFRGPQYGTWLSDEEVIEDLMYNPDSFNTDPVEGIEAYEKAFCATCHTFGPLGMESGPDLTTIGQRFSRADLVASILRPSEVVSDLWTMHVLTRTDGQMVSGTIFREDAGEVVVQLPGGSLVTVPADEIASREESGASAMPEGLLNNLGLREMRALIALLTAGPEAIPDSIATASE